MYFFEIYFLGTSDVRSLLFIKYFDVFSFDIISKFVLLMLGLS